MKRADKSGAPRWRVSRWLGAHGGWCVECGWLVGFIRCRDGCERAFVGEMKGQEGVVR